MEFVQKIKILKFDDKSFTGRDGNQVQYRQLTILTEQGDIFRLSPIKDLQTSALFSVVNKDIEAVFVIISDKNLLPQLKLKSI